VRHLAGVERWWFRSIRRGGSYPLLYYSDDIQRGFQDLGGDVTEAFAVLGATNCASDQRQIVADAASLDETGTEISSRRADLAQEDPGGHDR